MQHDKHIYTDLRSIQSLVTNHNPITFWNTNTYTGSSMQYKLKQNTFQIQTLGSEQPITFVWSGGNASNWFIVLCNAQIYKTIHKPGFGYQIIK